MNTLRNIFFALFVLIVTLAGCKKDSETTGLGTINSGIQLKNGYLFFKDTATFNQHLDWIRQNEINPELIYEFNRKFGFISFSEVYYEGMRINEPDNFDEYRAKNPDCFKRIILDDNSVFWEMPMASLLSHLVNKGGVFQIGETIYRLTEEFNFSTKNVEKLDIIMNTTLALNDSDIVYTSTNLSSTKGMYSYRTVYFPSWSDRRIIARLYVNNFDGMNYYEGRTTSQQQHWSGAWVQAKIHTIIQANNQGYYQEGASYPRITIPSNYDEVENAADFIRTILLTTHDVDFGYSSCQIHHKGIRYGEVAEIEKNEMFPKN